MWGRFVNRPHYFLLLVFLQSISASSWYTACPGVLPANVSVGGGFRPDIRQRAE